MVTFDTKLGWYTSNNKWISINLKDLTESKLSELMENLYDSIIWIHTNPTSIYEDTLQLVFDEKKEQFVLLLLPAVADIPKSPQATFDVSTPTKVVSQCIVAIVSAMYKE